MELVEATKSNADNAFQSVESVEADRKTEPTGYNLSPVEDEAQTKTTTGTDCSWK